MTDPLRDDLDFPSEEQHPDWLAIELTLERIAGTLDVLADASAAAEQQRNELHQDLGMTVGNGSSPANEAVRLLRNVRALLVVACLLMLALLVIR